MTAQIISSAVIENTKFLGELLDECIVSAEGEECLAKVRHIRELAKASRIDEEGDYTALASVLHDLSDEELLPIARAFNHFLNLANIVDQHHAVSRELDGEVSATQTLEATFDDLSNAGYSPQEIERVLKELKIELVLTAHPTEITRRSLITKHAEIDGILSQLELSGHTQREANYYKRRLAELISQIWHTGDFRETRPSPVDEAKWGFAVVENSLWDAVPNFMRRLEKTSIGATQQTLSLHYAPITFAFWMGGDRDGNPNVTAKVTREVLLLGRWKAADLYLRDVQRLIDELSMSACNTRLRELARGEREPYRFVLRALRARLRESIAAVEAQLNGLEMPSAEAITDVDELWSPLEACYQSLCESGMANIANSKLRDLLHRVKAFGVNLVKFDVRQVSDRHTEVMSELTQYLGLGDYGEWCEEERQAFLLQELENKRPLIPLAWQPTSDVVEVLDTCREMALHAQEAFGIYIISMARAPSDILLVKLLLRSCGCTAPIPVAPLFETLKDLDNASSVIASLAQMPVYRTLTSSSQTVMIGYSDSAKDAGVIAAGWAQYRAQESLLSLCEESGISLTLVHGRGGTVGRGGAPAHAALLSQPPGSLKHGLRETEQGETIRAKLGMSAIAIKSLALYTSAILRANLDEPPVPIPAWRETMDRLAERSCQEYRSIVKENENFVDWFRAATPETELAKLPLSSRPARRKQGGGIESLRAIPWIFAWSQNRLMLPAWLGAGAAIQEVIDDGGKEVLEEMCKSWQFFSTRISMLEMVFAKADANISAYYDSVLASSEHRSLGRALREQLASDIDTILGIRNTDKLMTNLPQIRASVDFRNAYVDPLNLLQAELLKRNRSRDDGCLDQAIMVTIAGISAGLRNTG